jgi:hypothetical protein
MTDKEMLQRILSRCEEDGGCLLWPGAMADGTCPQMRVKGKTVNVRRKHYELTVGPIPAGMVAAVTCECQRCIRHVELTDEERRKNADAQAKAAMLAGMIRQPALPKPK